MSSRSMIYGIMNNRGMSNIWNPNSSLGGAVNVITTGVISGGVFKLTLEDLYNFRIIEQKYTKPLSLHNFEDIPGNNIIQYFKLYQMVTRVYNANIKNSSLSVLLQITLEALTGAINSYFLHVANVDLNVINIELQNSIDTYLSEINVNTVYVHTSGTINMTKEFELAPLFKYYIKIYGLPNPGVGFDTNKLLIVLNVLEYNDIDPYN